MPYAVPREVERRRESISERERDSGDLGVPEPFAIVCEIFIGRKLGLGYRGVPSDAQTQNKLVVEAAAQQVRAAVVVFF